MYNVDDDAKKEFEKVLESLNNMDIESDMKWVYFLKSCLIKICCSSIVAALTSKAFTQVHKLAPIFSCLRQALKILFPTEKSFDETEYDYGGITEFDYIVKRIDVIAAFDIVNHSVKTFLAFKVCQFFSQKMCQSYNASRQIMLLWKQDLQWIHLNHFLLKV